MKESLRTFLKFSPNEPKLDLGVLWKVWPSPYHQASCPEFRQSYLTLQSQYSAVKFVEEQLFASDLLSLLAALRGSLLMWCVDDAIFIRRIDWPAINRLMRVSVSA